MLSEARKRRGIATDLPKSLDNPKPSAPDSPTHTSSNRQRPTIAPSIFTIIIVILSVSLIPVFYYTQVMIPSPESTSVLSEFKRKGNILLAALGDSSSKGPGRIPFSSQAGSPSSVPSDQEKAQIVEEKANEENNNDGSEIEERLKKILKYLKESIEKKDENKDDRVGSESGTIKSSAKGKGGLEEGKEKISDEERDRIDEEIGKFWKVTSEYRRKAQEEKMGQYSIQGDGTRRENNLEEEGKGSGTIEDLPDADPDSKEGLTPEIWEAIKQKFSSDDLTVMLNSVRKKEADVK